MEVGKVDEFLIGEEAVKRLDTVRVLHQTVVTLRLALEQSSAELNSLREQVKNSIDPSLYQRTIENLTVENHVLRQRVLEGVTPQIRVMSSDDNKDDSLENDVFEPEEEAKPEQPPVNGVNDDDDKKNEKSTDDERLDVLSAEEKDTTPRMSKGDSEESEEVDDIELIFTTDDTKEISAYQEDLVSIAETDGWSLKGSQDKVGVDAPDSIPANLRRTWANSVLVETDISKCGVIDENDPPNSGRRNTLAAPPPYRPIIHREVLTGSRGHLSDGKHSTVKFSEAGSVSGSPRALRPILADSALSPKQESGAQTDITAVPQQWKSESYLAHQRVSLPFTTLPSKFALPIGQGPSHRRQSLRLSEKTMEARRVLLSDINFTSMVPELSRSADYLCPETSAGLISKYPRAFTYMKNPNIDGLPSPGFLKWSLCDCSGRQASWESSQSIQPSNLELSDTRRRHSMRGCVDGSNTNRQSWASVPSSPTHFHRSRSVPVSMRSPTPQEGMFSARSQSKYDKFSSNYSLKSYRGQKARVKFRDSKFVYPGRSLPDLRVRFDTDEDSTDSLLDESEEFLRRSIDSMLSGGETLRRRAQHDHENQPPKNAQPFLVRVPSDLRIDYWVKVIAEDGRVVVGRVKYVGPLPGRPDPHVGVHLSQRGLGNCDGSMGGRRFFQCEVNSGVFVPFKKVVMAWSL